MKIAFAHYSAPNDISGVTTWAERLLITLHQDKFQLVVLLIHLTDDVSDSRLHKKLKEAGVYVEIYKRSKTLLEDINRTIVFLNQHQPTLFLPQCLNAFYFAAEIAGKSGLPWALTMHSDDPEYWSIAEAVSPAKCNGEIICVSGYLASIVKSRFNLDRVPVTIPYGVAVSPNKAQFSDRPFRVIYSGRVTEKQKRISLVLETMIRACKKSEHIECIIVGGGGALRNVKKEISKNNLEKRILLKGALPPQEVEGQLMRCQSILLMSDFEGLPVALLEAMVVGLVPVVREIPSGIPELVVNENTGLLVDDKPVTAANSIVRLSLDSSLWSRCSAASIKLIENHYNSKTSYSKWNEMICELNSISTINYPVAPLKLEDGFLIDPMFNYKDTKSVPFLKRVYKKILKTLF